MGNSPSRAYKSKIYKKYEKLQKIVDKFKVSNPRHYDDDGYVIAVDGVPIEEIREKEAEKKLKIQEEREKSLKKDLAPIFDLSKPENPEQEKELLEAIARLISVANNLTVN